MNASILLGDEALGVIEVSVPAGWPGPPLHHHAFAEAFYVLSGSLTFELEGARLTAGAGEFVHVPGSAGERARRAATRHFRRGVQRLLARSGLSSYWAAGHELYPAGYGVVLPRRESDRTGEPPGEPSRSDRVDARDPVWSPFRS